MGVIQEAVCDNDSSNDNRHILYPTLNNNSNTDDEALIKKDEDINSLSMKENQSIMLQIRLQDLCNMLNSAVEDINNMLTQMHDANDFTGLEEIEECVDTLEYGLQDSFGLLADILPQQLIDATSFLCRIDDDLLE
jgi:hypothetical protein